MEQYYAIVAEVFADKRALKAQLRPLHQRYIRAANTHNVSVCMGGPLLTLDGIHHSGTLLIVKAPDLSAVHAFWENDPYNQAKIFSQSQIRPWQWGLGKPEE